MNALLQRLVDALRADDDALAPFRPRIAISMTLLSALLLLPFTLAHFMAGRWMLGLVISFGQGVLLVNSLALRRGRAAPVPFWLMVATLMAAVAHSVAAAPAKGILWAYPAFFIAFFLMPRRQAQLLSLVFLVIVSGLALQGLGLALTLRVLATLTLTLVMINVVLNVIGEQQRELEQQAVTDALTGAFNRRHFDAELARLAPAPPGTEAVNVLLALDIDHFKSVNDQHGHAEGDAVLKRVYTVLLARKRPGDTLFRIGGEEFALLLPRTTPADAARLADELRQRIEGAALLPGRRVTVSIGVAAQGCDGDAADWLRRADQALYAAKRGGRNRVVEAA